MVHQQKQLLNVPDFQKRKFLIYKTEFYLKGARNMKLKKLSLLIHTFLLSLLLTASVTALAAQKEEKASVQVEDAAMYRGTITALSETENILFFTINQEKGTDFGYPQLTFQTPKNTPLYVETKELMIGNYIEVYYNKKDPKILQTETAIAVNKLKSAKECLFNGEVISIAKGDKKASGAIVLRDCETDEEIIYHYSSETQCYVDMEQVKKGDYLNIYHMGVYTASLPPQGNSLEIRKMAEGSSYRGIVTKIKEQNDAVVVMLKKTVNSDYKENAIKVVFNNKTVSNLTPDTLKKGMYVEVSYTEQEGNKTASTLEYLTQKTMFDYNGKIKSIKENKKEPGSGSITVTDFNGNSETIFHYTEKTKFHTPVTKLQVGDSIYIRFTGALTFSIPPQGSALEVSVYR